MENAYQDAESDGSDVDARPLVWIVDDDQSARESLEYLLASINLRTKAYRSASELLSAYESSHLGCLVIDVRMPGTGGLLLQEKLLERGCQQPIVFVTAYGDVATCARAFRAGAIDFLEKPVGEQQLLDIVGRAIDRDRRRRYEIQLQNSTISMLETLTQREREVMDMLLEGKSLKQIAADCGIGFATVAKHRSRVLEKLGVENDVELVRRFLFKTE